MCVWFRCFCADRWSVERVAFPGRPIELPRHFVPAGSRSPFLPEESTRSTAHLGRMVTNGTAVVLGEDF